MALATVATLAGCAPRYTEPPPSASHGHLAIYNSSHGGRLVAYHVAGGRSRRIVAFHAADGYRYVRIPAGPMAIRFEVNVGGVLYETKTFDVTGDAARLLAVAVDGPRTTWHEVGGPHGRSLIERVRSGSPLPWDELTK